MGFTDKAKELANKTAEAAQKGAKDVRDKGEQLSLQLASPAQSLCRIGGEIGSHQQARAGPRGERSGDDELGVVLQAVTRIGLSPSEIEYELTVRVVFEPSRGGGRETAFVMQSDDPRTPTRALADAAG